MNPPTSPKHTPIQSAAIRNTNITAVTFRTYARLVMESWRHDWRNTDWLQLDKFLHLMGDLDRATLFRHLAILKANDLITWSTDSKKRYRFFIVEVPHAQVAKSQCCDPSSISSSDTIPSNQDEPLLPAKSQKCDLPATCLDADAWQALREARIGEPARTELANLPHVTASYVKAMTAQGKRDHLDTGLVIWRMRNDWPAPDLCPHCSGLDGEHLSDCPTLASRRAAEAAAVQAMMDAHPVPSDPRFDTRAPWDKHPLGFQVIANEVRERFDLGMTTDPLQLRWRAVLVTLSMMLPTGSFSELFANTRVRAWSADGLELWCQTERQRDILQSRFAAMIKREAGCDNVKVLIWKETETSNSFLPKFVVGGH